MAESATTSRLVAWCQLVRVPNLLTVPGDVLVGYLLATPLVTTDNEIQVRPWLPAVLVVLAGILLYVRGLITNDLCDIAEDRRDRPNRPLPSGRVSAGAAFVVAAVMGAGAIVLAGLAGIAAMAIAMALVLVIWSYNRQLKRIPIVGPLAMGACRGLSVLLGAAAGTHLHSAIPVALAWTVYVAAVTHVAARETDKTVPGLPHRFLPGVAALAWFGVCLWAWLVFGSNEAYPVISWLGLAMQWVVVVLAVHVGWCAQRPEQMPAAVGKWIRLLLIMQAAVIFTVSGHSTLRVLAVLMVLVLLPVAAWLGKRFYAS